MAQYIKQGDIFGRIGGEIGKGLAEQIPKEVEHNRLAAGLQQFQQNSQGKDPLAQFADLASVYGLSKNPQLLQSFSELLKQRNQANAFRRSAGSSSNGKEPGFSSLSQDFANIPERSSQEPEFKQGVLNDNGQRTPNVHPKAFGQPQIQNEPPLADNTLARPPWTPEQRDDRIRQYLDQGFLADQARDLARDDENRDLSAPEAYEKRLSQLEDKSKKARAELTRQLETKLQKSGEGVFRDLTGENIINIERGMERDLRLNPRASFQDVANDWSNRALNFAKAKNQLTKEAATTGSEALLKGTTPLNKLKEYSNIYKRAGNSQELYNTLQLKNKPAVVDEKGQVVQPATSGYGLSPQGAASIAYPLTDSIKEQISKYEPTKPKWGRYGPIPPSSDQLADNARKIAIELEDKIDTDDSLLSIARELSLKDPNFDQQAFFDQLSEDKDRIGLNERQRIELAEGKPGFLPYWGDILIFPLFRRSK